MSVGLECSPHFSYNLLFFVNIERSRVYGHVHCHGFLVSKPLLGQYQILCIYSLKFWSSIPSPEKHHVFVHMWECVSAHVYVHIPMCTCVHVCICVHECIWVPLCVCMCVCLYMCVSVCVCVSAWINWSLTVYKKGKVKERTRCYYKNLLVVLDEKCIYLQR